MSKEEFDRLPTITESEEYFAYHPEAQPIADKAAAEGWKAMDVLISRSMRAEH